MVAICVGNGTTATNHVATVDQLNAMSVVNLVTNQDIAMTEAMKI
jgi:hypothetical protein